MYTRERYWALKMGQLNPDHISDIPHVLSLLATQIMVFFLFFIFFFRVMILRSCERFCYTTPPINLSW
jgi:hypothetical protein